VADEYPVCAQVCAAQSEVQAGATSNAGNVSKLTAFARNLFAGVDATHFISIVLRYPAAFPASTRLLRGLRGFFNPANR
jgi:hypothetical protein